MHTIPFLLWTQFWQVALLVIFTALVSRSIARRRPHLALLLWAVVIVKCLVPPLLPSPLGPFSWISTCMTRLHKVGHPADRSLMVMPELRAGVKDRLTNKEVSTDTDVSTIQSIGSKSFAISRHSRWPIGSILVGIWIGSATLILVTWCYRYAQLLSLIKRSRLETTHRVLKSFDDVKGLCKSRRSIGICVVDVPIGPAVVGWFSPTVILPKLIVDRISDEQLRILLAHEITHVRRGDLIWALLQVLAGSLWWFHPGVWWANRQLSQDIERCCDEDTISSIDCDVGSYAKCLLQVLEWKHLLKTVPALPGVRPMQVTKERLEGIYTMKHGSVPDLKKWWLGFLVVTALVAPGAEWSIGQQKDPAPSPAPLERKREEATPPEVKRFSVGGTVNSDLGIAGLVILEERNFEISSTSNPKEKVTRCYNVRDLLERAVQEQLAKPEEVSETLVAMLTQYEVVPSMPMGSASEQHIGMAPPALPFDQHERRVDGSFAIREGVFIASTSERSHKSLIKQITDYRARGFQSIFVSVELFEGPDELSIEGAEWQPSKSADTKNVSSSEHAILDQWQAASLSRFVSDQNRTQLLTNPQLIISNGSTSAVAIGAQAASTPGSSLPVDKDSNGELVNGVRFDLGGEIRANGRIWIEFRCTRSRQVGEPVPPILMKKQQTIYVDTAIDLPMDKFLAVRIQAPELDDPQKGRCLFALIGAKVHSASNTSPIRPTSFKADDRKNSTSAEDTHHKVIAVPRFADE